MTREIMQAARRKHRNEKLECESRVYTICLESSSFLLVLARTLRLGGTSEFLGSVLPLLAYIPYD